jgi:hypothetical protein
MSIPLPSSEPDIVPLPHFRGARDAASPQQRLDRLRGAARDFRAEMLAGPAVRYYRSCDLVRAPYPTKYALHGACQVPTPFLHILNRLFIVQYQSPSGRKTLLVSPTDVLSARETPFFKRLSDRLGILQKVLTPVFSPLLGTVEGWLEKIGLRPEAVDYITYDHLHTQDLRKWLGTAGKRGYFPNAKLLIMRQEWESVRALLAPQRDWYCPGGTDGIDPDRLLLLDGDVKLGDGVALLSTPGHTEGNHSIVVHTSEGLLVTSENGVAPDAYAPEHSRIPGLRRYARDTGMDVVLNANTLERGLDQYLSMVQEKEVAGPSARNPDFPNFMSSSELTAYWLFPGIEPTFSFGSLELGRLASA